MIQNICLNLSSLSFPSEIRHARRGLPAYGRAVADDSPIFGSDYTKPETYQTLPKAKKPSRPRPPAVNARREEDEVEGRSPWSSTLRGERNLKPWEKEALEMEMYQGATATEPFRPSQAPTVAPKPRITQITAQSTARSSQHASGARSVSPAVRKPQHSPVRSPIPQHQYNSYEPHGDVSGPADQPNVVHLQYNSPMGMYSKDNIRDAYIGQTQGRASKPAS